MLFFPIFDPKGTIIACDENGTPYAADNKNSNAWCKGEDNIPVNLQKAVGKDETLEILIAYFKSKKFTDQLINATEDEMYEAIIDLVTFCEISDSKKKKLMKFYDSGNKLEFLARVFQRSVFGNNKVVPSRRKKKAADTNLDSINEFNNLVRKKKPTAFVPESIQPMELPYVKALYVAYSKTSGATEIGEPDDLNRLNYRGHFERQRRTFYMAETIRREVRDSIRPGENDPFDDLKNEIEEGIIEVAESAHSNPVAKVDAVMSKAVEVSISTGVDDATNNWIGPGERKGVCHMLVNDERLKWV